MTEGQFQWHRKARVFAGDKEITPTVTTGPAVIPAEPLNDAIAGLFSALKDGSGFCVMDRDLSGLPLIAPSHVATLTGGSSGKPKVIRRSQASWIKSFEINAGIFAYTAQDSIAVLGGLSHSLALYGLMEGLHLGLSVHILSPLKPSGQSAELHARRCSVLYATPTQLRLLPKNAPLPDVRLILCGGGALGTEVRRHIGAICPNALIYVFYGAAETSFVTMGDSTTPEGSVGRPYPQSEIVIRDPDETGTGLVWVRSPYLFDGYLQGDSPHTRRDGDWLTVGEYGFLDADGYLFLRGRAGRVISVSDTTVFPEELEAQLSGLAGIGQCAILLRLDRLRGRHLIAVLDGVETAQRRSALLAHCKANGLIAPRDVIFLDPFPLLSSGKPDLQRIAVMTRSAL